MSGFYRTVVKKVDKEEEEDRSFLKDITEEDIRDEIVIALATQGFEVHQDNSIVEIRDTLKESISNGEYGEFSPSDLEIKKEEKVILEKYGFTYLL